MGIRTATIGAIVFWSALTVAAGDDEEKVKARLVSPTEAMGPGASIQVGVVLDIEEGWHVYWRNPGDAGMATSVEIEGEGLETDGELQWPVPIAFDQGGGIAGYGYERQALLLQDLKIRETAESAQDLKVDLMVSWLACKNVCVLGGAELSERLPLSEEERTESRALVQLWRDRYPLPGGNIPGLASQSLNGRWPEGGGSADFTIWLSWDEVPASVDWFPEPGQDLKISDVQVRSRANLTRVDFKAKRIGSSSHEGVAFQSLIVVERKDDRAGYILPVELTR